MEKKVRVKKRKLLVVDDFEDSKKGEAPNLPWKVLNENNNNIIVTNKIDNDTKDFNMIRIFNINTSVSLYREFKPVKKMILKYKIMQANYFRRQLGSPLLILSNQNIGSPNQNRAVYMEIRNGWLIHGFEGEKYAKLK